MVNANLTELIANVPTVTASIFTLIGEILTLFADNAILMAFISCAFIGIALKYGRRLVRTARGMA